MQAWIRQLCRKAFASKKSGKVPGLGTFSFPLQNCRLSIFGQMENSLATENK